MATISALQRVEACPASDVLRQWDEADSEPAGRGRAIHAYLDGVAKGQAPDVALQSVPVEHRDAAGAIDLALVPHSAGGWVSEQALAYDYEADAGRLLDVVDRQYVGLGETEVAGTVDLFGLDGDDGLVVLDVKTGWRWLGDPSDSLQLLAYARALSQLYARPRVNVGFLFVREDEPPRLVMRAVSQEEMTAAAERIAGVLRTVAWMRSAMRQEEMSPQPGAHCRYCPAYRSCPAHAEMVRAFLSNSLDVAKTHVGGPLIEAADLPAALERVRAVIDLAERVRAELEEAVRVVTRAAGPIPMTDGRVLAEVEERRERLDPDRALPVLLEHFGPGAADAVETKKTLTKASVEGLARAKAAVTKEGIGALRDAALGAIARAGGVTATTYRVVRPVKPSRLKAG